MKIRKDDILIAVAVPEELGDSFGEFADCLVLTGVGKLNAAYRLMKRLQELRLHNRLPKLVLNLGSAGSKKFPKGALVACHRFVQRDMDCTAAGYELGVTPGKEELPLVFEHEKLLHDLPDAVCGTGDSFVTVQKLENCIDVVEMEAYALAKVCKHEDIEFAAVKYITDGLDAKGSQDWDKHVQSAPEALSGYLKGLLDD